MTDIKSLPLLYARGALFMLGGIMIRLFDSSRDMILRLPVGGGTCSWSTDDGKTWNDLYHLDKAK